MENKYYIFQEPCFWYLCSAVQSGGIVYFVNIENGAAPANTVICTTQQIADWRSIYHLYMDDKTTELNQWFKPKTKKKSKK